MDQRRSLGISALAMAFFAVVAAVVVFGGPSSSTPTEAANQGGARMDLVVPGVCSTVGASVPVKCTFAQGEKFDLQVVFTQIPTGGICAWYTWLDIGTLDYKQMSTSTEFKDPGDLPYRSFVPPVLAHGDLYGLISCNPSTAKGPYLNLSINCNQSNSIELVPATEANPTRSYMVDTSGLLIPPTVQLDINCIVTPSPTPTNTPTPTPTPTNTPTPTLTPTVTPTRTPPTCLTSPPVTPFKQEYPCDTDQDGCSDANESATNIYVGGNRDYLYHWDFYDVWTHPLDDPVAWERDKAVSVFDILAVAARFGPGPSLTKEEALAESITPPTDETGYHAAYDRGPVMGENFWNLAPPDAAITIPEDILGVAGQFGHSCAGF